MTKRKDQQGYFWDKLEFNKHVADMSRLNYEQKGIYQELRWMDCADIPIPADRDTLALVLGVNTGDIDIIWHHVGHLFTQVGDIFQHVEGRLHRAEFEQRSAKAKESINKRWGRDTNVPHEGYERNTSRVEYSKEDQVPCRPLPPTPPDSPPDAMDSTEIPWDDDTTVTGSARAAV